ncbi:MAG: SMC-Scp complex subunit ScpB [Endomicrobiaceae bacterium]|nr:SMC-Scp complex subunit ScpB [Endomicrobiaceae bacterium]
MEINDIKKIIESLLFVSDKPLLNREIKAVIKEDLPENVKIEDIMQELQQEYVQLNRAFELKFVADGWTFATKPEYSNWIKKLLKEKTILKLSPSAMEVLAIIAYKQPITRAEIDTIRGVDCGGVIDTLTDRKFIKIVGRKETLGRPLLYGTTQEFLRHFGLSHLSELPVIETTKDVLPDQQEVIQELPFDDKVGADNSENKETDNKEENKEPETQNQETAKLENTETENTETETNIGQNNGNIEQQNENVVKEENDLNKDVKENVDVSENVSDEQNNTEN